MLDRSHIGMTLAPHTARVDARQLQFFAKATAQPKPDLMVPPTYLFCLEMEAENPTEMLDRMEIDIGRILHANQEFTYHRPIHTGEELTFQPRVSDIFDKKGGALEFVVKDTEVTDASGVLVAELRSTIVVRN